jgi:hypothetical protein
MAMARQEDSRVMLSAAKHLDAQPPSPSGILDMCLRLMPIGRPLRCYSDELRITDYDVYQAAWNIDDFLYGVVTDK